MATAVLNIGFHCKSTSLKYKTYHYAFQLMIMFYTWKKILHSPDNLTSSLEINTEMTKDEVSLKRGTAQKCNPNCEDLKG